jgi:uncharacterized protein DUF3606
MPDSKLRRGPEDPRTISFSQTHERELACHRFRCSERELWLAIQVAGTNSRATVAIVFQRANAAVAEILVPAKRGRKAPRKPKPTTYLVRGRKAR